MMLPSPSPDPCARRSLPSPKYFPLAAGWLRMFSRFLTELSDTKGPKTCEMLHHHPLLLCLLTIISSSTPTALASSPTLAASTSAAAVFGDPATGHAAPAGPFAIPILRHSHALIRRSNPDALRGWALREKGRIRDKYETGTEQDHDKKRRRKRAISTAGVDGSTVTTTTATGTEAATSSSNATIPTPTSPVGLVKVLNYEADLEYFASVGVGVPPQYVNLILDTGSADLWIASSNCTPATGCAKSIPLYNSSRSLTGVDTSTSFTVKYGSGSAAGEVWKDYVSLGGYNVSGQGLALCDSVSSGLVNGNMSGLFGLGFQQLAASGVTPFWQNLYQAGVFPFPGFAFSLTRFSNLSTASLIEPGGELTLGYLNSSFYEAPISYISIPQGLESYWLIPMDALAVNGTNVTGVGTPNVAIDTGTTLIGGPSGAIAAFYAMIPGSQAATGLYTGYYSYPCASLVNITFRFGGISYNMSSDDFNLGPFGKTNNVSTCLGAFFDLNFSTTSKISWVIGAAFLKNVYTVFRAAPASVGFALLSPITNYTSYGNGTGGNSIFGNGTNLPNGFFGPSGATSLRGASSTMTTTTASPTTAIEAGQTASHIPSMTTKSGARSEWEMMGRSWGTVALGGIAMAMIVGFLGI